MVGEPDIVVYNASARARGPVTDLDPADVARAIAVSGYGGFLVAQQAERQILKDLPAIDRLGAAIFERWKKLDILVGNAGILGKLTPLGHIEPKTWDEVMAVNVTANFRLIRAMDPLLRAAPAGRAVFMTSGAARSCPAYWGAYSVSKAALEAMVRTYAAEVAVTKVRANCFSPGPTRTKMRSAAMPGEDPKSLPSPEEVALRLMPLCRPDFTGNGGIYAHGAEGLHAQ